MKLVVLVVVVAAALVGGVEDISGWRFVRSLPVGAAAHGVQTVAASEPVRDGKTALRFEVRPGDCSAGANNGWDDCASNRERA